MARPTRSHRYIRAYLAGIALPTLVVGVAGSMAMLLSGRLAPSVQHALLLPVATNPPIWGLWNALWAVLAPRSRLQIGWHGAILAVLLIGVGTLLAARFDVPEVTPQRAAIAVIPTGLAYYALWRYGVSFLNSLVGLDTSRDGVAGRIR